MSEKERLQLENELLMTCSKAQAINKYIDELEENSKLSELWCKSQQENQQLKENNMSMQEEMARTWKKADLYKEVIEKLNDLLSDEFIEVLDKETIIQILDKAKEVNKCKT